MCGLLLESTNRHQTNEDDCLDTPFPKPLGTLFAPNNVGIVWTHVYYWIIIESKSNNYKEVVELWWLHCIIFLFKDIEKFNCAYHFFFFFLLVQLNLIVWFIFKSKRLKRWNLSCQIAIIKFIKGILSPFKKITNTHVGG